ncbi:DUF4190 domain-containing protein [Actinomycetospora atypica]|uniref:DUF4190 domain-containing protein n=1 Tax=Actinomycetospora atypica TaxID=1290095 RepID=A0ABV9YGK4_9PSEU
MTQQMPPPSVGPMQPPSGWFPPQAPPPPPPPRNAFGIAALCLALVGLVFGLVPFTGFLAVILGLLALVFGMLGFGRVQQRLATNKKMTIAGAGLGVVALALGIWGIVIVFQATNTLTNDLNNISAGTPSYGYSQQAPTYAAPSYSAPTAEAPKPTSYTYEVTGNYPALFFNYTDSNGDSYATYQHESGLGDHSKKLPWKKTVTPEPNGGVNSLGASTSSSKGNAWITCTVKDDKGNVISTETKRGAYAQCYASSLGNR